MLFFHLVVFIHLLFLLADSSVFRFRITQAIEAQQQYVRISPLLIGERHVVLSQSTRLDLPSLLVDL